MVDTHDPFRCELVNEFGVKFMASTVEFQGDIVKLKTDMRVRLQDKREYLFYHSHKGLRVLFFKNNVDKTKLLCRAPAAMFLTD